MYPAATTVSTQIGIACHGFQLRPAADVTGRLAI
jgi:hypothetical protein